MKKVLSLALTLSLLPSCMSLSTGSGPNREFTAAATSQPSFGITFSVELINKLNMRGDEIAAVPKKEDFILAFREEFESSGLFTFVHYAEPAHSSSEHYHFKIVMTGDSGSTRTFKELLAGLTLMTVPTWKTTDVDISLFYMKNGKEYYSAANHQAVTDVIWLPLIVASPFMNHLTVAPKMKRQCMGYFLEEIHRNQLHVKKK